MQRQGYRKIFWGLMAGLILLWAVIADSQGVRPDKTEIAPKGSGILMIRIVGGCYQMG